MEERETHAVTGAFGFSGKYIARRLLDRDRRVITLTDSIDRHSPFGAAVETLGQRYANELERRRDRIHRYQ